MKEKTSLMFNPRTQDYITVTYSKIKFALRMWYKFAE